MNSSQKIFLSCVTAEFAREKAPFGKTRQDLAAKLRRGGREVKSEEDFRQAGKEAILETLDDFIRDSAIVVQFIGDQLGEKPSKNARERLLARIEKDGNTFLNNQTEAFLTALPAYEDLTYIQWEALLALHHNRPLFLYRSKDSKASAEFPAYEALLKQAHTERHFTPFEDKADLITLVVVDTHPYLLAVPAPLNNLPGSIGYRFKGRATELREVHEALQHGTSAITQAITGLGGIGKTRLALEYAYLYADEYTATFLLSGDGESTLITSLTELTSPLYLDLEAVHHRDTETRLAAVLHWLSKNENWLLIVDNVDSEDAREAIQSRLGLLQHGKVLITSRRNDFDGQVNAMPLGFLSAEAARDFLLDRTQRELAEDDPESAALDLLVENLDGLALAIEQAAAYIAVHKITFTNYNQYFETNRQQVLAWKNANLTNYDKTVATTWLTTFAELSEDAKDLLNQISFLAPEPIPRAIFEGEDVLPHESAINDLARYSLVEILDEPAETFQVHRLVQDVVQGRLGEAKVDVWSLLLNKLATWAPNSGQDIANWPKWEQFEFHATELFQRGKEFKDILDFGYLISGFAGYEHFRNGNYPVGEALTRRALSVHQELLGVEHPATLARSNDLAVMLLSNGEYEKAETLFRQSLYVSERILGVEHSSTLTNASNLGLSLHKRSDYDGAESLFRRTLEIRERELGEEHPDTLTSLNNLASLLDSKGEFEEAELLFLRAHNASNKTLGPEHPNTLVTLGNLACLLRGRGAYEEAEPLYVRVLRGLEHTLGKEHPDTLLWLSNFAGLLAGKGEHERASEILRRSLEGLERVLGKDHPTTLTSVNNLGLSLKKQGVYREAELFYRRAWEGRARALGSEHPKTLSSINNLAVLLFEIGDFGEAKPLFRQVISGNERILGTEHPDTLSSINNLACLLETQKELLEAEVLYKRVANAAEATLGEEHPHTRIYKMNLQDCQTALEKSKDPPSDT
ncbi:MAG: hypothetical protein CMO55_12730 [Verrucomicrobiales bacterium]|nr:hypothetical protein [Verrucomicrobiales bacterium]